MKMLHGLEQSDGVITVGGRQEGSTAQGVNQTVDMPSTEHDSWGVTRVIGRIQFFFKGEMGFESGE